MSKDNTFEKTYLNLINEQDFHLNDENIHIYGKREAKKLEEANNDIKAGKALLEQRMEKSIKCRCRNIKSLSR